MLIWGEIIFYYYFYLGDQERHLEGVSLNQLGLGQMKSDLVWDEQGLEIGKCLVRV